MDNFPAVFVMLFGGFFTMLLILSSLTYSEVDGTVRDKYISNSTQYLLVDYSTGETERWHVIPEVYEDCEVGDNLHRESSGTITCE